MAISYSNRSEILRQCLIWALIMVGLEVIPYLVFCAIKPISISDWVFGTIPWLFTMSVPIPFAGIIHYYWLYNGYLKKKRYLLYSILLLPLIALILVINFVYALPLFYLEMHHYHEPTDTNVLKLFFLYLKRSHLILLSLDLPFIIFYTAMRGAIDLKKRRKELEFELQKTAILLLKRQLEPHFLFNTLNAIYATAQKEQAAKTLSGIEELSGMARYVTEYGDKELVPVESELKFVEQYLQLQKQSDHLANTIESTILWDRKPAMIRPMILLPLVEYIFNTGSVHKVSKISVQINIESQRAKLVIVCTGKFPNGRSPEEINELVRIKKLLENTYKNNFQLEEKNDSGTLSVSLDISLEPRSSLVQTTNITDSTGKKKNEALRQFVIIWLIIFSPFVLDAIVHSNEFEPGRFFIYFPVCIAAMSFTIVGHYYLLYKRYIPAKRYLRYISLLLAFTGSMILLDFAVDELFELSRILGPNKTTMLRDFTISVMRVLIAEIPIAFVYAMVREYQRSRKAKTELEFQNKTNEFLIMKNKMKPGFINDVLNTLYTSAIQEHALQTSEYIKELKELFSYAANDADKEKVSITEELNFINRYLHLQRMRITDNENINIDINIHWDKNPANIAPMLFLPFVENAFKYGISYELPSKINIDIRIVAGKLDCLIVNTDYSKRNNSHSSGKGLSNTIKRLELQYNNRYQLVNQSNNSVYTVSLKLDLN